MIAIAITPDFSFAEYSLFGKIASNCSSSVKKNNKANIRSWKAQKILQF